MRGKFSAAETAMSSGEPVPNTVRTSPGTLSNSILAIENAPTSQPARVNGTHGAGKVLPFSLSISGLPSPPSAVQYRNELEKPTEAVAAEEAIAVCHRHAHAVPVGTGQHRQDIGRGMRDQRRVVIAAHRAVVLQEIEQIGHLLEVRWHVGVVPPQVHVIELDVHDMLDPVLGGFQSACRLRGRGSSEQQCRAEQQWCCGAENAAPLAQVVHQKTGGNPFFAIQFISALAEEGLLAFDHGGGRWSWDPNRIHAKGYTDNVVELMVGKLNRLPLQTQKALQELACLGNSTEISTLSIVHGTSEEEVHSDLWEAIRLEFIVRLKDSYKFVHDRIQEAAYSLIPEEMRTETHLRMGRRLAAHTPPQKREEAIFEIVNQFNRGAALITSREEREQLAELNLHAGERAKASTAFAAALKYLFAGAALLGDDCWERRHELAFALELHRAECEFLTGELAAAAERLTMLSSRAANTVERATVACLRVDLYTTLNQSDRAVAVCLDYLRSMGVEWPPHPTEEEGRREYERIWSQLGSRAIEELIKLPLMSDPVSLATLDVLTKVLPPALFTDANLLSLVICRAVNLSLEHGNSDGSCFAYVWLGVIAGPHFDNYKAGFRFGRLGYELVEKRGLRRFQARTYVSFGNLVMPWTKHVKTGRDLLRREFEAANKIGDLTFAAYSRLDLNTNLLAAGDPLVEVQRETEHGLEFAHKMRFGLVIDRITAQLGLIRTLRGLTQKFGSFDDGQFDELRFEGHLCGNPALALPECWYWTRKLQARFFAGDYAAAVDCSLKAQRLLWTANLRPPATPGTAVCVCTWTTSSRRGLPRARGRADDRRLRQRADLRARRRRAAV